VNSEERVNNWSNEQLGSGVSAAIHSQVSQLILLIEVRALRYTCSAHSHSPAVAPPLSRSPSLSAGSLRSCISTLAFVSQHPSKFAWPNDAQSNLNRDTERLGVSLLELRSLTSDCVCVRCDRVYIQVCVWCGNNNLLTHTLTRS